MKEVEASYSLAGLQNRIKQVESTDQNDTNKPTNKRYCPLGKRKTPGLRFINRTRLPPTRCYPQNSTPTESVKFAIFKFKQSGSDHQNLCKRIQNLCNQLWTNCKSQRAEGERECRSKFFSPSPLLFSSAL